MATHINLDDPQYRDAAAQILSRHDALQPEANITSAVRQFLVLTGLVRNEEIVEENPPSDSSRRAAAVAIGLAKMCSHWEKTRLDVMPRDRRS